MNPIKKLKDFQSRKGWLLVSMLAVVLIALAVSPLGVVFAAGGTFTENWAGASSPFFSFLQQGGGTIASNVADSGAGDGRVVQLNLAAFPAAGPNAAPNLLSTDVYGFGTYEARMKTADCASQPNTGIISGFFTYLNDGTDQNGNGIKDNSEIDFEWLCAEPNVIWLTAWTDYQESPTLAMRRIYRELDLRTGQIRRTCYSTNFGQCDVNLTGSATEGSPSSIAGISNYNSATAYYTYGFTWLSNRLTWYIIHPTTGAKVILWDYQGPTSRITQRQARYMFNVWHTNNWPPPSMPGAIQQPTTSRNIKIDWAKYTVPGAPQPTATRTRTPTVVGPTATRTRTPTQGSGGTNLAAGRAATGSIAITSPGFITDGEKGGANFAGLEVGPQWIQLDLGQSYNLTSVKLWHYFADARTYRDVIVQLSNVADFSSRTTVFNNDTNNSAGQGTGAQAEYAESSAGREIVFSAVSARYVRLWTNGSSANGYNHYVEVEVYAGGGAGPTATRTPTLPASPNRA